MLAGRKPPGGWGLWVVCAIVVVAAVASGIERGSGMPAREAVPGEVSYGHGRDAITGTRGHDRLTGTEAGEMLFAFGGEDIVDAGDGNDLIDAGNGDDVVYGGEGDDRIRAYDGHRDVVRCGDGEDVVFADVFDTVTGCEDVMESSDSSSPPTPEPPIGDEQHRNGAEAGGDGAWPFPSRGTITLVDRQYECRGPVDLDLVKVTIHRRSDPVDAISLGASCTGRIGRIEVDTWSGDGVKVQNAGAVAHDLVVESGYVRCYERTGEYHQDGIHVMGGYRITFRNLLVSCGRRGVNANLFIARGGQEASTPTEILFENGRLGPEAAHTILLADAVRSGVRRTAICRGRWFDYMIQRSAIAPVDVGNVMLAGRSPRCARVSVS